MSKGSSGKQQSASGPSAQQKRVMAGTAQATMPILQELTRQILEALKTGGVGAQIPILQRLIEAGSKSASDTTRSATTAVARSGAGEYGRNLVETVKGQGGFNVSQAALQAIQALIGQAPDTAMMRGSPVWGTPVSTSTSTTTGGSNPFSSLAGMFKVGINLGGVPTPIP
jgi:hypothetical protein